MNIITQRRYEYLRYVAKLFTWFALVVLTMAMAKTNLESVWFVLSLMALVSFTWYVLTRDV